MSEPRNRIEFEAEINGEKVKLAVVRPTAEHERIATKSYVKAFSEALGDGALLRTSLETYLRRQGAWDDTKEQERRELQSKLSDYEYTLEKGGIKLSEARRIALEMRQLRAKLLNLLTEHNRLDAFTAEGRAEAAKHDTIMSLCVIYAETNKTYFASIADYLSRSNDEVATMSAVKMSELIHDFNMDYFANLPEHKFLLSRGFMDSDYRLVNQDGKFVDEEGRLIDKEGYYVDVDGNRVDLQGRPLNTDGTFKVDSAPFLDDEGNPIA